MTPDQDFAASPSRNDISNLPGHGKKNHTPIGLGWRSSTPFIIFVIGIAIFTDLFIYAIIVPVLPFVLRDRVGVPDEELQLHVSVLLGIMAASSFLFSPVAGVVADAIGGRQKPFLAGLGALGGATVLLAVGRTVGEIALARVLQGMSSAVVWCLGLAVCLETVGPGRLGTVIGTIFSFVNLGTQAAPVLGGVLYEKAGYGSVFGISVGLIGIDIVLRLLMIEKRTAARYAQSENSEEANGNGNVDGTDENTPLLNGEVEAQVSEDQGLEAYRLPKPTTWLTKKVPILLTLRSPALLTALFIGVVQATLIGAFDSTLPLIGLGYYGFNSLQSGLMFLALSAPGLVIGPLSGWAVDKFGTRIIATAGYAYLIPLHILLRVPKPGGTKEVVVFVVILAFAAVGNSMIDSPSLVEAGLVTEKYHKANPGLFGEQGPYAQLYAMNSMSFSFGITVGPIVAGALKDAIGYGNMNAVMASICAVAAVLSWLFLGTTPVSDERVTADENDGEEDT